MSMRCLFFDVLFCPFGLFSYLCKKNMEVGRIYVIRNTENEKVYIGQTIHELGLRLAQHKRRADTIDNAHRKLYNAMKKYGKEKFYIELLEDCVPIDELNDKEIHYIKAYNSFERGYNSTAGGDSKAIYKDEDISLIKSLLSKGETYINIANIFGVNVMTIQRLAHSLGIRKYKKISKEYLLANIDRPSREIAEEWGVNKVTVDRAFRKNGILRGKGFHNSSLPQNKKRT